MKKIYTLKHILYISVLFLLFASSCKKDKKVTPTPAVVQANAVSLGLFEYSDGTNYRIFIPLTKIGNTTVNYDEVFDTGSAGLTIDAADIIPDSLITNTGFKFTGDSLVVNGITITSTKSEMDYGNQEDLTAVKGNVAYANITIDNEAGGLTIKRVPIFLYYAIFEIKNGDTADEVKQPAHSADIFGVSPEYSYASNLILSPLSYYTPGTGLTKGFKLSTLIKADFTSGGVYEQHELTLGLTQSDLTSSGFIMHPLTFNSSDGYSTDIPGTVTYGGNTIAATFLFDTGTPELTIIEDKTASSIIGPLPLNSSVTVKTNKGFTYTYTTTASTNLTTVKNPNDTQDPRTILSLEFFIDNEFLTDYSGHQIGLKNN